MQFFKTVIPKPDSSLPKFDNEDYSLAPTLFCE